jgi:hypothetical protein
MEWNKLDEIKLQSNKTTFKIELKNKFLQSLISPA